jgi:hypothetical protein
MLFRQSDEVRIYSRLHFSRLYSFSPQKPDIEQILLLIPFHEIHDTNSFSSSPPAPSAPSAPPAAHLYQL